MSWSTGLICPRCINMLKEVDCSLICEKCLDDYKIRDGIAIFSSTDNFVSLSEELFDCSKDSKFSGWDYLLYNYNRKQLESQGTIEEDQRIADWRYLLPLAENNVALVLGSGLGYVPMALAEKCKRVYAVDSLWENVSFINSRKTQLQKDNLFPVLVEENTELPFAEDYFDIIALRRFFWGGGRIKNFRDTIKEVYRLLKIDGIVNLNVENRFSIQNLLSHGRKKKPLYLHTIYGYKKILQSQGFYDIQFFAPLPRYDGVPLFYIPLESVQVMNFFFKNIFPLIETVSPEVKRKYAMEYFVAKAGVRLSLLLKLTGLARLFVPGFSIFAKKGV